MSSVNIYVTFNPLIPQGGVVSNPNVTLTSGDVEVIFTFKDSPGMFFNGFSSTDNKNQLTAQVADDKVTVTDLDSMAEQIEYTLTLRDTAGQIFIIDPQIINNPKPPAM